MNYPSVIALGIVTGFAIAALAGCADEQSKTVVVESSTGRVIDTVARAEEVCYKGVIYVNLNPYSDGRLNWGGAKFNPDGKVATCKTVNKNTQ